MTNPILYEYLSIKTISEITGANYRTLTRYCQNKKYTFRKVAAGGGKNGLKYEILVSSLEPELQNKIILKTLKSTPKNTLKIAVQALIKASKGDYKSYKKLFAIMQGFAIAHNFNIVEGIND